MRPAILLLVLLPLAAGAASGAPAPYLVHDVNPVPLGVGSDPREIQAVAGGRIAFSADDGFLGRELWGSDGTASGTVLLADLCPGECPSFPRRFAPIRNADGSAAAAVFQVAERSGVERHLWWTDGTPAGTLRLTRRPLRLSYEGVWLPARGLFFFTVDDPFAGRELWVSEARRGSARRLLRLRPAPLSGAPSWLRAFGGRLFFFADDGVAGPSLWTSDGTAAGTRLVKDTWPRSASHGAPTQLTVMGNRLIFVAASPDRGDELWRSDGTAAGTVPLADLVPGPGSARFGDFVVAGARLFFQAQAARGGQEMWVTDGTARGTRRLTSLPKDDAFVSPLHISLRPTAFGSGLVFAADDGVHGEELWVSDGTAAGTVLLRDVCPGPCSGGQTWIKVHGGGFFFRGENPVRGAELWVSDGTPAGTRLVKDLCRGACSGFPSFSAALGDDLLFFARDAQLVSQLWRTDGTPRGTVRIRDFPGQAEFAVLEPIPGAVLFAAGDPEHGRELWVSDGTPAGTALVEDIDATQVGGSFPQPVGALGGDLLFFADDGEHGFELWASDGTAAGTRLVHEALPGGQPDRAPDGDPAGAVPWRGALYYRAAVPGSNLALWRSDGTAAGTRQLTPGGVQLTGRLFAGDALLFFTARGPQGPRLWVSDGTPDGTRPLSFDGSPLAIFGGRLVFFAGDLLYSTDGTANGAVLLHPEIRSVSSPRQLAAVHGGLLYFFAEDPVERGVELWRSDGTAAGTRRALDFALETLFFSPSYVGSFGGRLVLSGGGSDSSGLWVSDGTAAGTTKISETAIDGGLIVPAPVAAGSRLFFVPSQSSDSPLWVTDGTAAGTGPVLDAAGDAIIGPRSLSVLGGRLYVAAGGLGADARLWVTDGTPAGTTRLPEPPTGIGSWVAAAGNRVFFSGYDRANGTELWAVEP